MLLIRNLRTRLSRTRSNGLCLLLNRNLRTRLSGTRRNGLCLLLIRNLRTRLLLLLLLLLLLRRRRRRRNQLSLDANCRSLRKAALKSGSSPIHVTFEHVAGDNVKGGASVANGERPFGKNNGPRGRTFPFDATWIHSEGVARYKVVVVAGFAVAESYKAQVNKSQRQNIVRNVYAKCRVVGIQPSDKHNYFFPSVDCRFRFAPRAGC